MEKLVWNNKINLKNYFKGNVYLKCKNVWSRVTLYKCVALSWATTTPKMVPR